MEKLALKIKVNKLTNYQIIGPIIYHEVFPKTTRLVQGYCKYGNEWCWHLWVQDMETLEYIDIIEKLAPTEMGPLNLEKTETKPVGEILIDNETIEQWKLYEEDPKQFWKSLPKKVQDFRSKFKREINLKSKCWTLL